jgi:hypothetical protein
MRGLSKSLVLFGAMLFLPCLAYGQVGSVAGTVRDSSGAVVPGVTVEVTSPALIEKVRSTTTDDSGRYQITALPVGTYTVTFSLTGFSAVRRTTSRSPPTSRPASTRRWQSAGSPRRWS